MSTNIPARNRAIKKLLQETYHGAKVSVRAGNGTAYHWVHVEFLSMPEELKPFTNGNLRHAHVLAVIESAGIHIHTYAGDDDYTGNCIEIRVRGARHHE